MSMCALLPNKEVPAIKSQIELMEYFSEVGDLPIKDDSHYKANIASIRELLSQIEKK